MDSLDLLRIVLRVCFCYAFATRLVCQFVLLLRTLLRIVLLVSSDGCPAAIRAVLRVLLRICFCYAFATRLVCQYVLLLRTLLRAGTVVLLLHGMLRVLLRVCYASCVSIRASATHSATHRATR